MVRIIFLLLFLVSYGTAFNELISNSTINFAQICYGERFTSHSTESFQHQFQSFARVYQKCNIMVGDLIITNTLIPHRVNFTDIFANLLEITGRLIISNNHYLENDEELVINFPNLMIIRGDTRDSIMKNLNENQKPYSLFFFHNTRIVIQYPKLQWIMNLDILYEYLDSICTPNIIEAKRYFSQRSYQRGTKIHLTSSCKNGEKCNETCCNEKTGCHCLTNQAHDCIFDNKLRRCDLCDGTHCYSSQLKLEVNDRDDLLSLIDKAEQFNKSQDSKAEKYNCCSSSCLVGCFNSIPGSCYFCSHMRNYETMECVDDCQGKLNTGGFVRTGSFCVRKCPNGLLRFNNQCVLDCQRVGGYADYTKRICRKCVESYNMKLLGDEIYCDDLCYPPPQQWLQGKYIMEEILSRNTSCKYLDGPLNMVGASYNTENITWKLLNESFHDLESVKSIRISTPEKNFNLTFLKNLKQLQLKGTACTITLVKTEVESLAGLENIKDFDNQTICLSSNLNMCLPKKEYLKTYRNGNIVVRRMKSTDWCHCHPECLHEEGGCLAPDSPHSCLKCKTYTYVNDTCASECDRGFYLNTTTCFQCHDECVDCIDEGSTKCFNCRNFYDISHNDCVNKCGNVMKLKTNKPKDSLANTKLQFQLPNDIRTVFNQLIMPNDISGCINCNNNCDGYMTIDESKMDSLKISSDCSSRMNVKEFGEKFPTNSNNFMELYSFCRMWDTEEAIHIFLPETQSTSKFVPYNNNQCLFVLRKPSERKNATKHLCLSSTSRLENVQIKSYLLTFNKLLDEIYFDLLPNQSNKLTFTNIFDYFVYLTEYVTTKRSLRKTQRNFASCATGCSKCIGHICMICKSGYYLNIDKECVTNCPLSYYPSSTNGSINELLKNYLEEIGSKQLDGIETLYLVDEINDELSSISNKSDKELTESYQIISHNLFRLIVIGQTKNSSHHLLHLQLFTDSVTPTCLPCADGCGRCDGDLYENCMECIHASEVRDSINVCVKRCRLGHIVKDIDGRKVCVINKINYVLYAIYAAVAVFLLIIAIALSYLVYKRWKAQARSKLYRKYIETDTILQYSSYSNNENSNFIIIPQKYLKIIRRVGGGAFGGVYFGYLEIENDYGQLPVAIKVLNEKVFGKVTEIDQLLLNGNGTTSENNENSDTTTCEKAMEILKEASTMARIQHKFCIKFLGVTVQQPLCIATEYAALGSLTDYMEKRKNKSSKSQPVNSLQIILWSLQIAKAMKFLHRHGIIHRDLAARNVLVCETYLVKVADFGLSHILCREENEFTENQQQILPVRSMAIESLTERRFNEKTDVWSYGITIWEICTFCETPYSQIQMTHILNFLKAGNRLQQPLMCTVDFFNLLILCWMSNPEQRPTFDHIANEVEKMITSPRKYIVIKDDRFPLTINRTKYVNDNDDDDVNDDTKIELNDMKANKMYGKKNESEPLLWQKNSMASKQISQQTNYPASSVYTYNSYSIVGNDNNKFNYPSNDNSNTNSIYNMNGLNTYHSPSNNNSINNYNIPINTINSSNNYNIPINTDNSSNNYNIPNSSSPKCQELNSTQSYLIPSNSSTGTDSSTNYLLPKSSQSQVKNNPEFPFFNSVNSSEQYDDVAPES
ncbi:hypothetical protein SNEBB_005325 [Seison nebaliae]|nr:hypothetical protein SNEBB_005325 [Seison nebaliae]